MDFSFKEYRHKAQTEEEFLLPFLITDNKISYHNNSFGTHIYITMPLGDFEPIQNPK